MVQLSPYHASRAKQKRICPQCLKHFLYVRPAGDSPNVALDCCDCGYRQVVEAPRSAWVEQPETLRREQRLADDLNAGLLRKRSVEPSGRIIHVDFKAPR